MSKQRTVVVTGADRSLGFELVRQYLERGDIVFAGKYKANWHLLEELQPRFPDRLTIVEMDVSSTESVNKVAEAILAKTDKIDILINNAGVWLDHGAGTILDGAMDYDRMLAQFNINALGALRVTQALIHAILKSYDRLVANVSSEASSLSGCRKDRQFGYCMSKVAMNMQAVIVLNAIRSMGGQVILLHPGNMQSVIGAPHGADAPFVEMPTEDDVRFYTTPEATAKGFIEILSEPERFAIRGPGFVNYRGDAMPF